MRTTEHERAGDLLVELRRATDGYRPPDDGCIHKENHVLFPAAMRLADAAS